MAGPDVRRLPNVDVGRPLPLAGTDRSDEGVIVSTELAGNMVVIRRGAVEVGAGW